MSPRRPRRRARRRSQASPVLLLVAIAVTGALLVGGLTRIASQSGTYDADSNRSLAAQGGVVADQSNATAATVRALIAAMPSQTRQGLQAGLDSAVQQTSEESSRAALAAGSAAAGSLADQFAEVFAERAQAVSDYRAAVDGFLGMQPVPPAGTSNTVALAPSGATLLSATAATDRITAAGALLARAPAALGVGAPPGRLGGGTRRRPGRPARLVVDPDSVALSRVAHGEPRPTGAAGPSGRAGGDGDAEPDHPGRGERRARQPRVGGRAPR